MLLCQSNPLPTSWVFCVEEDIFYRCLWPMCNDTFLELKDFEAHFQQHIIEYFVLLDAEELFSSHCCPIIQCGLEGLSRDELSRHLSMHIYHASRQYNGLQCIRKRNDMQHFRSCSFESSCRIVYSGTLLICEWTYCGRVFEELLKYTEHIDLHVNLLNAEDRNKERLYICQWRDCDAQFDRKCNLRSHARHHSGDKPIACPFCGTFLASNWKLYEHLLRKLVQDDTRKDHSLRCQLCRKVFDSVEILRDHCRRHVMNYKCKFCSVTLNGRCALERHIASIHEKKRNFFCGSCGKSFGQKSDRDRHMAVHSDELGFICEICGDGFRWKKQLNSHLRAHQEGYEAKLHLCHLCDCKYKTGFGLTRHLVKIHRCSVPSGFSRFQYKKCADGYYRLQTRKHLNKSLVYNLTSSGDDNINKQ